MPYPGRSGMDRAEACPGSIERRGKTMGTTTDEQKKPSSQRVAELHRYDKDLMGANWRPEIAIAALMPRPSEQEARPRLPEDSEALEAGFVVNVRALASRI